MRVSFASHFFSLLYISVVFAELCSALYADQAGKFDWRQQYVGAVTDAHFDHSNGSWRIIVTSEQNVLAAVSLKTSHLLWRQILESDEPGVIQTVNVGNEILSVIGSGSNTRVRSWEPSMGCLNWETNLEIHNDNERARRYYHVNTKDEAVVIISGIDLTSIQIDWYNYRSGELTTSNRIVAHWFNQQTSCGFVSNSFFACIDKQTLTIYSLPLIKNGSFQQISLLTLDMIEMKGSIEFTQLLDAGANKDNLFAVTFDSRITSILKIGTNGIIKVKTLEGVSILAASHINERSLIFLLSKLEKDYLLQVYDVKSNSFVEELQDTFSFPSHFGRPSKIFVYVNVKKEGGYVYRALLTTNAHSLVLLQHPGKMVWVREESMASILAVEMVDLPVSESEARMEEQFGSTNTDLMLLFGTRIASQLSQLRNYVAQLLLSIHDEATGMVSDTKDVLIRDDFNIHKIVVVVTVVGKVFGVDNLNGKIIWQTFVPSLEPYNRYGKRQLLLFVQRTTTHYPHSPQCSILGQDKHTKQGVLYVFNPITGSPLDGDEGLVILNYQVIQALQLPYPNAKFLRGLVLMDNEYKLHLYPDAALETALQHAKSLYLYTADVQSGELRGFNLGFSTSQELIADCVWSMVFSPSTQAVKNVVMKRTVEHVHSQGRVLGDRSVLYKYLNPNLAVVTTEGYASSTKKSSLNIYLIDVVSGKIVFSITHKQAKGPVHVIHSENWIVYTLFNDKYRRVEAVVLELYEGKIQSNTTAFSSLAPPPSPMIERQAYILPSVINTAAVTITEKGITNKHLLFALPSGGILELPKAFLDPRRSIFPTPEHREEGVFPYNPELPIASENVINYHQSVYRIRGIYTAPTGLESTCLVLAYGLDLFFTRVTPSRTFDILKDDFDHWLIVAVLLSLLGASYLTKKLAAKKALKHAWK